jgi:hypothetical protein
MLTTKKTVSGLRKVTNVIDELVKANPERTHQEIARLLVQEHGAAIERLREEIQEAKADGQNPFQRLGLLARLVEYQPIFDEVQSMLVRLGRPQMVDAVKAA